MFNPPEDQFSSINQSEVSNHILDNLDFKEPGDEFKFVNKDDSIQRDMSFHNTSKGSILNSSDVDPSEDGDKLGALGQGLTSMKSQDNLGSLSRIKSSNQLLLMP